MKKVGIVTCYFKNNYGSILQSYATQKFLDINLIENETINIDYNEEFKRNKRKFYLKQLLNLKFVKSKFGMIKYRVDKKIVKNLGKNVQTRLNKFNEFRKNINLSEPTWSYEQLSELSQKYSDIIVGSDQLWLPVNVVSDYYTLNWVDKKINKISYSTSFGISTIPKKYDKLYYEFLKKINHISVREESGNRIVNNYGLKSEIVCDPTLLLTREQWENEIIEDFEKKEKYILCYFLGKNKKHRKFAEKLRMKTGMKIISINHCDEYVRYSDKFADEKPYDVGPREWLSLIKNAEYVCTDSFHGTIFSLIFNRKFFVFKRYKDKNKMSTNSRIISILKILEINKKFVLDGTENIADVLDFDVDYREVNKKLNLLVEKSKKWLLNSIEYSKKEAKMAISVDDKRKCTGCTACYSACPNDAIEMVSDHEGFLYPKIISERCLNCGLCKKKCPILNSTYLGKEKQKAYIFQNMDSGIRETSTAGGFFSKIGSYVINKGGIVFGAAYDENFVVNHTYAEKIEDLNKFKGSKYVQSNQKESFEKVKKFLVEGRLVCYSGTPCQVGGLHKFLDKKYENLITVDIMCHSVPSPLVFEKYKEYVLKIKNASEIKEINFRDKSKYGYKYPMMTIETNNGEYSEGIDTDPYLRAFFGNFSVRPSCYDCKFKTQKRVSDITIWDCFNINDIDKNFDDDKGTTRLLIHTKIGEKILNELENCKMKEIAVCSAVSGVKEMTRSVNYNQNRKEMFGDIDKDNFFDKWFPLNFKTKVKKSCRKFLIKLGIYAKVKKMVKKILNK